MNRDAIIFLTCFFVAEAMILIPLSIFWVKGIDEVSKLSEEEMQQMRDSF